MQTASLLKRHGSVGGLRAKVGVFVDDASTAHWPVGLGVDYCGPPPPPHTLGARGGGKMGGCWSWTSLTLGQVPGTFGSLPFSVRYYLLVRKTVPCTVFPMLPPHQRPRQVVV